MGVSRGGSVNCVDTSVINEAFFTVASLALLAEHPLSKREVVGLNHTGSFSSCASAAHMQSCNRLLCGRSYYRHGPARRKSTGRLGSGGASDPAAAARAGACSSILFGFMFIAARAGTHIILSVGWSSG